MEATKVAIGNNAVNYDKDIQLIVYPQEEVSAIKSHDPDSYLMKVSQYASQNKVYVVPGLYIRDNYLCLCIIDNNGNIVYEQKATHLNQSWFSELRRGNEIEIVKTQFGNVFLCADVDIYKPEVLRIAALMEADIVISCQYIKEDHYSHQMILSGAWQQAQQNCLYVVSSTNIKSSIIGPCETVNDLSGFIKEPTDNYPIIGEMSMSKRANAYDKFAIFNSLNHGLYKNHIKELCK